MIYEVHPVVHHYTNFSGIKGILQTDTLWASHYSSLNDALEVKQIRPLLEEIAFDHILPIFKDCAKKSLSYRRKFEKEGGVEMASKVKASRIIDSFYGITFEGRSEYGVAPFAEPYVFSLCAHTNDEEYEKDNGLLSMWRGYGEAGGFAIELDTHQLWKMLEAEEHEKFCYSGFYFAEVIYDTSSRAEFSEEFSEISNALAEYIRIESEGGEYVPAADVHEPFFNVVTRFKHQGFREENEIRIVVSPISYNWYEIARETELAAGRMPPKVKFKQVFTRKRNGKEVRYIVLNQHENGPQLPIRRIIVGPRRDQEAACEEVVQLVRGRSIDVVRSETPYIP